MPKPRKEPPSPEQVRRQVDQVMDRWQSYPDFGALLDALMAANGLTTRDLARRLAGLGGSGHAENTVARYRRGELDPPYAFIDDLVATNVLHLDPSRLQSADGKRPAGDHRVALFTAAGLVEVSPEAVRHWNLEVLAGHRRLLGTQPARPPRWGDLLAKLLAFHLQGGRQTLADLAGVLGATGSGVELSVTRLHHLLQSQTRPTGAERLALARQAGLDDDQIAYIEDGIAAGAIPLGFPARQSPFTSALGRILDKLACQNIGQTQLALLCASQPVSGALPVQQSDLSYYCSGRHAITLQKLRSLTTGLKQLASQRLADPVTAEEINGLIVAAGFTANDLSDTTHEIIARIDNDTRIKPLLSALRYATDVSMAARDVVEQGRRLGISLPHLSHFKHWEQGESIYPTGLQVKELLECYNHFIRRNGFAPLEDGEIASVVQVAERDHARWHNLSAAERLTQQKPRDKRRPLSPSLAGTIPGR